MNWDEAALAMDEAVDGALGDLILLSTNSGASFSGVRGFVIPYAAAEGLGGFDEPLGSRIRMKMAKRMFPDGRAPDRETDRMMSGKLGSDTYRPAGSHPDDQGRYWIFDIQKV